MALSGFTELRCRCWKPGAGSAPLCPSTLILPHKANRTRTTAANTIPFIFMRELRVERRYCIAMLNRREFGRTGLAAFAAFATGRSVHGGSRSAEGLALHVDGSASLLGERGEPDKRPSKPMRGAFIILTTPFTASGEVDWDDLAREALFVDRCGCHGIVWPQGSSGVANLTKAERMRGMTALAAAVRGKTVALVLGVQGADTAEMLEYARRAEALEPDAMIAMPPSAAHGLDDYRDYFRAL